MTKGEKIRCARKEKGLTQKRLGELSGINETTIRRYELNLANPKIETLQKIANGLEIPVNALLDIEEYRQAESIKDQFSMEFNENRDNIALCTSVLKALKIAKCEISFVDSLTEYDEAIMLDMVIDKLSELDGFLEVLTHVD